MENQKTARFSIATLLLVTALIAIVVSHISVSRELAKTKADLSSLRKDALMLDVEDRSAVNAVALPTFGDLQWRWKVQLPSDGKYRLRYCFDDIPDEQLKSESMKMDGAFLGSDGKPLSAETPFVLTLSIHKQDGLWQIAASNGNRGTNHFIKDPPSWLDSYSAVGWGSRVRGHRQTSAGSSDAPFELIRMRKTKAVAGGSTIDTQPTDGVLVWLERITPNAR